MCLNNTLKFAPLKYFAYKTNYLQTVQSVAFFSTVAIKVIEITAVSSSKFKYNFLGYLYKSDY